MSFMPSVAALATAGTEKVHALPMSPYAFGAIAFASFLVLLGLLWSFRNTAAKYDTTVRVQHGEPAGQPGSHGSTDPGAHH